MPHLGRAIEIEAKMSDITLYEGAAERAIENAEADWLQAAEALEALKGGEGS